MKFFRKHIKKTPALVLWFWLFIFFADASNLDDFLSNGNTIHTDNFSAGTQYGICTLLVNNGINSNLSFTISIQKHIVTSKTIYDQDSPSITPELVNFSKAQVNNPLEKKVFITSVSIIKILYIEQRSLLI